MVCKDIILSFTVACVQNSIEGCTVRAFSSLVPQVHVKMGALVDRLGICPQYVNVQQVSTTIFRRAQSPAIASGLQFSCRRVILILKSGGLWWYTNVFLPSCIGCQTFLFFCSSHHSLKLIVYCITAYSYSKGAPVNGWQDCSEHKAATVDRVSNRDFMSYSH